MAKSTTSITPTGEGNVADFLEKIRGLPPVAKDGERGKLIFAMDATMSRQPSWDRALSIQAEMFAELPASAGSMRSSFTSVASTNAAPANG